MKIYQWLSLLLFFLLIPTPIFGAELAENLNLARIYVNPGTLEPEFSETRTYYTLLLKEPVDNLIIQATPVDENLTYEIKGNDHLKQGENLITITVFSKDKERSKTYTINVLLTEDPDPYNALLNTLIVDNYSFTEEFFPEVFEYTITGATNQSEVDVFAYPQNSNASVKITGNTNLKDGENTITIDVTSQNGLAKRTYQIKLDKTKDLSVSNKEEITISTKPKSGLKTFLLTTSIIVTTIVVLLYLANKYSYHPPS